MIRRAAAYARDVARECGAAEWSVSRVRRVRAHAALRVPLCCRLRALPSSLRLTLRRRVPQAMRHVFDTPLTYFQALRSAVSPPLRYFAAVTFLPYCHARLPPRAAAAAADGRDAAIDAASRMPPAAMMIAADGFRRRRFATLMPVLPRFSLLHISLITPPCSGHASSSDATHAAADAADLRRLRDVSLLDALRR